MAVAPDGEAVVQVLHRSPEGVPAQEMGAQVAEQLRARGAVDLLERGSEALLSSRA